jgi:UDP-3-O-[3-hydroxymyristoyl] glucosamine N-acyltransferase
MSAKLSQLLEDLRIFFHPEFGFALKERQIQGVASQEEPKPNHLVFAQKNISSRLLASHPETIWVFQLNQVPQDLSSRDNFLAAPSLPLALAKSMTWFEEKKRPSWEQNAGVHPTAVISPMAIISPSASIGPHCVVGDRVRIGDRSRLEAQVNIDEDCQIGADCHLSPFVYVGPRTQLGDRVQIQPHSTIGSPGFGFAQDTQGLHHAIPQIGFVSLESDVSVGANCAIDRGTFGPTRIGSGTKLDNFVHIAHNCDIGKNCLITAGFIIAGSSKLGDWVVTGGSVRVTDHVEIGSKIQLGGMSVVSKDVLTPGAYGGHPLQPLKDYLRTYAAFPHLSEMRKTLKQISEKLNIGSGES